MESAAYIEQNISDIQDNSSNSAMSTNAILEEYTPKLFSDEQSLSKDTLENSETTETVSDELFDQDINEEEDFEIPAFLRKQKF